MTTAVTERGSTRTSQVPPARVVVVSEDPGFIEEGDWLSRTWRRE